MLRFSAEVSVAERCPWWEVMMVDLLLLLSVEDG
jgi:hypothetical protein